MKRTLSLRTKIILLMTLLLIVQNIALVMSLSSSRVFFLLDAESFRLFENTTKTRMETFNQEIGQLIANVSENARDFSSNLQSFYSVSGLNMDNRETYNAENYNKIALKGSEYLIQLLQNNSISGAFFTLMPNNHLDMPSVYIRNSTPKTFNSRPENFLLEAGPISVAQKFSVPTSVNWNISNPFQFDDSKKPDYYQKPIAAALNFPRSEMERYGYWTSPTRILPDLQSSVCYTLPLLSSNGSPIGIMGIEISLNHFAQYYLPLSDLPYQDSFYVVTQAHDNELTLDWSISASPLAHIYLPEKGNLLLEPTDAGDNIYSTKLEGLGDVYCFVQPLTIYSRNSPYSQENWHLLSFVPHDILHEGSSTVRTGITVSILVTSLLTVVAIFLLSYVSTRKISGLSKYIAGLSPHQNINFRKTGMREIDDLTAAVERLNQNVIDASKTTSKILELSLLPIGGFEVNTQSGRVILTEYIYDLLGLDAGTVLTIEEWETYYYQFIENPAPEFENIYQYSSRYDRMKVWLRILISQTATGYLGVILDVTREVEEHRQLKYELDHDSMTHLYNRKSFKREVHAIITQSPHKIGVMLFSDLDNLKYINDTFGHDTGDRLILRAGEMFQQFSLKGGIVSRISGDEFAIYLHGFSSKEEARAMIKKQFKKNELYKLKTPDGISHRIRSSTGAAWYPENSTNVTDLLKLADFAMYEAKHKEKGTLFEFNQASYESNAYLLENREAIHRLIDERLIHFHFQPIISLKTGQIYAYEALMRPSLDTFKTPMEILSVAAAQSQLGQLERLVFATAFETIQEQAESLNGHRVFINSIPSHFMSQDEFKVLERKYGHLFSQVVIEVTERESESLEQMSDRLSFVRNSGIKLALDDFGNGYSSEVRILTVKPDIVKIDMMLIQGIHSNRDKEQLVANLISFCHSKGVLLVAEGVETKEDLVKLIELDMDFVQGYYTGKPNIELLPINPCIQEEIQAIQKTLHKK